MPLFHIGPNYNLIDAKLIRRDKASVIYKSILEGRSNCGSTFFVVILHMIFPMTCSYLIIVYEFNFDCNINIDNGTKAGKIDLSGRGLRGR